MNTSGTLLMMTHNAEIYAIVLAFFLACVWAIGFDILRLTASYGQSWYGKTLPVIPFLWVLVIPLLYAAQFGTRGRFPRDAGTSYFMVYGYWIHVGIILSIWLGQRRNLGLPFAVYAIRVIFFAVGQTVMYSSSTFNSGVIFIRPSEMQTVHDLRMVSIIRCIVVEVIPIMGVTIAVLYADTRSSRWFYKDILTKSSGLCRTNPV